MSADSSTVDAVDDSSVALIGCKDFILTLPPQKRPILATLTNPNFLTVNPESSSAGQERQIDGRGLTPCTTTSSIDLVKTRNHQPK